MKTNLLVVALFISTASFAQQAQTAGKTDAVITPSEKTVDAGANSSVQATTKTDVIEKTSDRVGQTGDKAKKDVNTEKNAGEGQISADKATVKQTVKQAANTSSVSSQAGAGVTEKSANNKVSGDASISGQAKVSPNNTGIVQKAGDVSGKAHATAAKTDKQAKKATVAAKNDAKSQAKNAGNIGVKSNTAVQASKPKPVKMNTQIKTNAALKIK
jgi:hypothetical protein